MARNSYAIYRNFLLSGCASHKPVHKQLGTSEITVGVHNNEQKSADQYEDRWSDVAAGKVSESLEKKGLMSQAWKSTTSMLSEDTYSLELVTRDKISQIMEEKRRQFESGGYERLSEDLSKIQGLNLIVASSVKNKSSNLKEYKAGSWISDAKSKCSRFTLYTILQIESIRVDNGEIITTGQYEGESSRSMCNPDQYPSKNSFNKEKLILRSFTNAANKFAGELKIGFNIIDPSVFTSPG